MSSKVVFIVGLPGSGKSYLTETYAAKPFHGIFDDISIGGKERYARFEKDLKAGTHTLVVSDIFLCDPKLREKAVKKILAVAPNTVFEWIFFENSPVKCRKNVIHRNDGRAVEASIARLTKCYTIPEGVTPLKIWQKD